MMIYKRVKCPHCGQERPVRLPVSNQGTNDPVVWWCGIESGGCDKSFVLQATVDVALAIFTLQPVVPAADSLGGQTDE